MYVCMCSCLLLCTYVCKYIVCVGVFVCACMYVEITLSNVEIQKNTMIHSGYSVLCMDIQVSIYDGWHTHMYDGRHALLWYIHRTCSCRSWWPVGHGFTLIRVVINLHRIVSSRLTKQFNITSTQTLSHTQTRTKTCTHAYAHTHTSQHLNDNAKISWTENDCIEKNHTYQTIFCWTAHLCSFK